MPRRKFKKKQPKKSTEEAQESGSTTANKMQVTRSMSPEQSYYHTKNVLWVQYQAEYTPLWKTFREHVTTLAENLGRNPAKHHLRVVKGLHKERNTYIKAVLASFENYISDLTKAWIKDALAVQGISLADAAVAAAQAAELKRVAKHTKKLQKKITKKHKFPKPTAHYTKRSK